MKIAVLFLGLLAGCGALRPLGVTDAACTEGTVTSYADADGDGFGDSNASESTCGVPAGRAAVDGDCDDGDAARFPENPEICDGVDNDCNSAVDDGLATSTFYTDADGDGYGDPATATSSCGAIDGLVTDGTDCDDADGANSPGLTEVCDGIDNDCDDRVDDSDDSVDPASLTDWYHDADGDGYGDGSPTQRCAAVGQYTAPEGGDCDESDPNVNPGALESCDGVDDDCDNLTDDADPSVDPADLTDFYADADHDGLGAGAAVAKCAPSNGWVSNDSDCDDTKSAVGAPVDWYTDADGDGWGNGVSLGLSCPPAAPGTALASIGIDCNDANNQSFPGNTEVCGDGIDNDCQGGDLACTPIGWFDVNAGPYWHGNPPVYTCLQACALLFGGSSADYQCSTTNAFVDNQAYASGFGDATYCTTPIAEDFSKEQAAAPGYNCGSVGCSYSAYVMDNCLAGAINWCWAK